MKLEVSTNLMVTDLAFFSSTKAVGSGIWLLKNLDGPCRSHGAVAVKVACSFETSPRSAVASTATVVSAVSANSEKPEIETDLVPPFAPEQEQEGSG